VVTVGMAVKARNGLKFARTDRLLVLTDRRFHVSGRAQPVTATAPIPGIVVSIAVSFPWGHGHDRR